MLAAPVIALCSFLQAREPTSATSPTASQTVLNTCAPATSPFDRVDAITLSATDPTLQGHGPCRWIDYVAEFSGTLHVWTKVEGAFDTFLRVDDDTGKPFAEDDDSGGKPTPYVKLEVEPGTVFAIAVAASKTSESGKLELHLVAAPETDTTRAQAARAQQELAEIRKLREAADLSNARARAIALVEHLSRVEHGTESELVAQQLFLCGVETHVLALLGTTEIAWRAALTHRLRTLPTDHTSLQWARGNLALAVKDEGDLAEARALEDAVVGVFSRTLSADHPDLQSARLNLANTIKAQGELAGAQALEEAVVEVLSRTLHPDHPDLLMAQENIASTMIALGDLAGARALFEQVLEVRSRTLPQDHPDLQRARGNLAGTMYVLGDVAGAHLLFEQVLEVYSRTLPADHPDLLSAQVNLAVTIKDLGDLAGARALEEQVLESWSRTLPKDHPDLQRLRGNLAATIRSMGDLAGARTLFEQVLEVRSRTLPQDHPDLQKARLNLASTINALGDPSGARMLEEQVLEIRSRTLPPDHPDLQAAREYLALTMYALGDFASARALFELVLEILSRTLPQDHPDLQAVRGSLAFTIKTLGDLSGARELEEQVLEARTSTLPPDHRDLQAARANLAVTMSELGDLAGARALQEQVLEVLSRTLPDSHPNLQVARLNLTTTIARETASEKSGSDEGTGKGKRHEFAKLASAFTRSLALSVRNALLSGSSREAEERCVNLSNDVGRALSLAEGLGVFESNEELEHLAFLSSEGPRGASLVSASLVRRATGHPRYAELREEMRSASAELARSTQGSTSPDEFDRARSRRDVAERELVVLAKELLDAEGGTLELDLAALSAPLEDNDALVGYRRYPRFRVEKDGKLTSTESLCAFVLRSGERLDRIELGLIEPIEAAVHQWRDAIGVSADARGVSANPATSDESFLRDLSGALRRLVFDPLLPALEGVERVIVALDDVLHLVPLDALPAADGALMTGESPTLIGDRWRIETRVTLAELLAEPEPLAGAAELLAIGGVDYGGHTHDGKALKEALLATDALLEPAAGGAGVLRGGAWSAGFTELASTSSEVHGIAQSLHDVFGERATLELLEGAHATREGLVTLAPKARFLHVATHGWFAPESIRSTLDLEPLDAKTGLGLRMDTGERVRGMAPMLLCGLALAGANRSGNELGRAPGLMTAEEISTLDLSNCELAVLSACDTNVGERRAGQGVASLQRALHMAGARTVITSLWKVPDEATKELMLDFYRRIWVANQPVHEALWAAKKKLRDSLDEQGRRKYTTRDWAAWVLTGQPE